MKKRTKLCLLTIFVTTFLFTIGFAGWIIKDNRIFKKTISIDSEDTINSSDYFYFDETKATNGIKGFKYYNTGFLNDDSTSVVNSGEIIVYFEIDFDKCRSKFNDDKISVDINLKYASYVKTKYDIFNDKSNVSLSVKAYHDEEKIDANDENPLKIEFDNLSSRTGKYQFYVVYTFTVLSNSYFRTTIYEAFINDGITFTVNAKLSN